MGKQRGAVLLTVLIYAIMFLFGLILNTRGVTYPLIKNEFNASYGEQGTMVSMLSIGYVIFCILSGLIIRRWGLKTCIMLGFASLLTGLSAFFLAGTYWVAAGILLILYAGFGLFEIGINATASRIFTTRPALKMNLLHFCVGLGSAIGPRIAGFVSERFSFNWKAIYGFYLIPTLLLGIAALRTPFPKLGEERPMEADGKAPDRPEGFRAALKEPYVWFFALIIGLSAAVESGTVNWSGLYLMDVYGRDPRGTGAFFVSSFFIFFTLARLVNAFAVERVGYFRSVIFSGIMLSLLFIVGFMLGEKGLYILPLTGFFCGVMWPTIMALSIRYFRERAPLMNSIIIVIAGSINSILQLLIGLINRYVGEAWGYRSCLLYALLLIGGIFRLYRSIGKTIEINPHS